MPEGSVCYTHENRLGVCKLAHNCVWIRDQISARQMKFSDIVRCGWRGNIPILCCSIKTDVEGIEVNAATPPSPVIPQM